MAATKTTLHANWPASSIEWVPIEKLIPYARNPRKHSEAQIAQIVASMNEFGWTMPILRAEDQTILAGHGRLMAAAKLGWLEAPVMTARGWSETKKRQYVIADNKLALNADWDVELLMEEIQAIIDDGLNIDVLGFSEDDLSRMSDDLMGLKFSDGEQDESSPTPEDHLGPRTTSNPEQVPFGVTMLVSQRDTVFEAIQKAKREFGVDQSAEALWLICQRFLQQ
jgi:hypothetical protein